MSAIDQLKQPLQRFFDLLKENKKLALFTVFGVLVFWCFLNLELIEYNEELEAEYLEKKHQFEQQEPLRNGKLWEKRKEKTQKIFLELESRLWPIQSEGLAQAGLHDFLIRKASEAGLRQIKVKVGSPIQDRDKPNYLKISGKLISSGSEKNLEQFFAKLFTADKATIVEQFDFDRSSRKFSATISALMPHTSKKRKRVIRRR